MPALFYGLPLRRGQQISRSFFALRPSPSWVGVALGFFFHSQKLFSVPPCLRDGLWFLVARCVEGLWLWLSRQNRIIHMMMTHD
jgi:hypothetical protein